jgi:5S rRNA maturation endonuclease (ribonuclease M5)
MKQRRSITDKRKSSEKAQDYKELCYRHSDIGRNMSVYSPDADRAERLKKVLQSVYEANKQVPIIVEGRRDADALRKLGLTGEIIILHSGKAIYDFCEAISEHYDRIVLLMDWDEKGDKLFGMLVENLRGYWEEFSPFRDIIKVLCQKDIKEIEGIPGLLEKLAGTNVILAGETDETRD